MRKRKKRSNRNFPPTSKSFLRKTHVFSIKRANNYIVRRDDTQQTIMCIEASLLDSLRLHLKLSKTEAKIYILHQILKRKPVKGWQTIKVPKKPIVYIYSQYSAWNSNKTIIEVYQNPQFIVECVDGLQNKAAEESILKELINKKD